MSVISRNIWPVCGSLCCFCPALRERSRHPIKRYKKLLADIFPRSPVPPFFVSITRSIRFNFSFIDQLTNQFAIYWLQDEEPNERMIGKLCEYAARNPLRVPKACIYYSLFFFSLWFWFICTSKCNIRLFQITSYLEQRCYRELRTENYQSVKVVICIYRKLLISCKDQMWASILFPRF